jgi:hypothetical protein
MTQISVPSINFHLPTQVLIPLTFVKQIVKSKIPSYLKDQVVPIISHDTPIATKIFKYKYVVPMDFNEVPFLSRPRYSTSSNFTAAGFFLPLANIYLTYPWSFVRQIHTP